MLPVTHGERYTKLHILLYTLVLFAVSLMPFVIHMSGLVYLLCALALARASSTGPGRSTVTAGHMRR